MQGLHLRTTLLLGYLLPILILTGAAVMANRMLARSSGTTADVTHTNAVLAQANALRTLVVDAETGERGFFITGDLTYLEPYQQALARYPAALADLQEKVDDNEAQRARLERVDRAFGTWNEQVATPIIAAREATGIQLEAQLRAVLDAFNTLRVASGSLPPSSEPLQLRALEQLQLELAVLLRLEPAPPWRDLLAEVHLYEEGVRAAVPSADPAANPVGGSPADPGGAGDAPEGAAAPLAQLGAQLTALTQPHLDALAEAQTLLLSGQGKRLIDSIRLELDAFVSEEQRLLAERSARSQQALRWAELFTVLCLTGAVLLSLLLAFVIARTFTVPLGALVETARTLSSGDLRSRFPVGAKGELGELGGALNRMADELVSRIEGEKGAQLALQERLDDLVAARTGEITVLNQLAEMLQAGQNLAEALRVVPTFAQRLFPGTNGALYLYRASRNLLEPACIWGSAGEGAREPSELAEPFHPDACWALRRGKPHGLGVDASALRCGHQREAEGPSCCYPLHAQGETLGIFFLRLAAPDEAGSLEEIAPLRTVELFADRVALAVANLRLRESLHNLSIRDPLTNLYNRRYLEDTLERETSRAARVSEPLSIILFDVDHFKTFNDTFGHEAGDVVLREVASLAQGSFRHEDVVCRYGGEEFVVLLPGLPEALAEARAKDFLTKVGQTAFVYRGETLGRVTISVGVAGNGAHGYAPEVLLRAADEALYEAKRAGRNRVVLSVTPELDLA